MIHITHDIDWINPLHPYSIIKSLTHADYWINISRLFKRDIFLNQLTKLIQTNQTLNINPTYFIGSPTHAFGRFDLRYTIHDSKYTELLAILKYQQIGLHSDTHQPISAQHNLLQNLTNQHISQHRSHYLQHNILQLTTELQPDKIKMDYSRGKAKKVAYLIDQTINNIQYIPTILFDNIFFAESEISIWEKFNRVLAQLANNRTSAAILFHPENMIIQPKLELHYHHAIQLIQKHGLSIYVNQSSIL